MAEMIVLVPGIGLGGSELMALAGRLRRKGYAVQIFRHNPWRRLLKESAAALQQMLQRQAVEKIHLVGHSLGGLVALQMLQDYPEQRVGRIVTLGTPHCGCLAARRVVRAPGGRWLLGNALISVSSGASPGIPVGAEVGAIAGRLNVLLGLLLCPREANDTLVCVNETRPSGLIAHCVLPVSHTSMVLSGLVSDQIACFLESGRFSEGAPRVI